MYNIVGKIIYPYNTRKVTIITLEKGDRIFMLTLVYEMNTKIPLLFDFLLFAPLWVKGINF